MFKFFVLIFCFTVYYGIARAQSFHDMDRQNFIETMNNYDKTQKNVQQPPTFKGGYGALYDYLQGHIVYPAQAKKEGLSAQVFVAFTVDYKTGLPKDVKVVQSSNKIFDKEALRIIKAIPAWIPGRVQNSAVSLAVTIPVYFHLK